MLRRLATLGAALGALLVASPASAQQAGKFGDQGQFIFSADRLFGLFAYTRDTFHDNGANADRTFEGASMAFFWGANSLGGGNFPLGAGVPSFYTVPRLGFDYTLLQNFTVGGDLTAWFTLGGNTSISGQQGNTPLPSSNVFGIAPRAGYILGLSDLFSIWLRGGLHFYGGNYSLPQGGAACSDSLGFDVFGLTVDPQFVITPFPHVAFTAGPALDWGFTGGTSESKPPGCNVSTSNGFTSLDFALNGGLLLWL